MKSELLLLDEDGFQRDYCESCQHFRMVYEYHPDYYIKTEDGERLAVKAAGRRCTKIAAGCDGQHWEPRREQRIYGEIA